MKVLLAVDGHEDSNRALDFAFDKLLKKEDSVIIATVIDKFTATDLVDDEVAIFALETITEANKELEDKAKDILGNVTSRCKEKQISYKAYIVNGNPGVGIVGAAKDTEAELVVVGSRGLGTVQRLLLGSVSEYIVNNAPCPVLVVRNTD